MDIFIVNMFWWLYTKCMIPMSIWLVYGVFSVISSLSQETLLDKGMVVFIQLQGFLSSGKTCQSERQVPKHRKTQLFSQNPKQMRLVKDWLFFQQHNFQSRHDIRTKSKASVLVFFLVWNKIKRLFSKARRFHLMRSWKTDACLLQAAEIPRHYPSSRIRGEWGKRCSKILRRKDGGKLGGNLDDGIARYRGFGLSKISKCLADMTPKVPRCHPKVFSKSLLQGDLQDTPEVVRLGRVNCDNIGLGS